MSFFSRYQGHTINKATLRSKTVLLNNFLTFERNSNPLEVVVMTKFNVDQVTVVTQLFLPDNQAMSIRMKYLVDALRASGMRVKLLTSSISKGLKDYDVECVRTPVATNKDKVYFRLMKELLFSVEVFIRLLFKRTSLVIITSPPFTIAFFAVLACRIKGARYIFDVRDEYPEVYFTEGLVQEHSAIGRFLRSIEKWIYVHSALTLTVTTRIVEKLQKKSGMPDKIYLLRNGFSEQIRPIDELSLAPFVLLFHGNMGKFQNPQLIVEVAEACQQRNLHVEFWIYGWGSQTDVILENEARLSNLRHMGKLEHHEIPAIIEQTSIGISFQGGTEISRNSFPSKVMEFIGSGVPVILTPISEAGSFVEEHQVGFQFDPDQSTLIADKIEALVQAPEMLKTLSRNALAIRTSLSRKALSETFVAEYFEASSEN